MIAVYVRPSPVDLWIASGDCIGRPFSGASISTAAYATPVRSKISTGSPSWNLVRCAIVAGVLARLMQVEGSMTCDVAWQRLKATAANVITWDPVETIDPNGNPITTPKPLVNRR